MAGDTLQSLKAYHFAVLEGAYFKGKLFASISSSFYQGTLMQDDFFSEIAAGTSFLSNRTQNMNEESVSNKSWYLFVPVLSSSFTPFMSTLGEKENAPVRQNSWDLEGRNVGIKNDESCNENESRRGCAEKRTNDYIDWEFLELIAMRVRNLKRPGIDSIDSVKHGDVVMASHNPCVYKVLGVRKDLNMMSDFPAEPSSELTEKKDLHEVSFVYSFVKNCISISFLGS